MRSATYKLSLPSQGSGLMSGGDMLSSCWHPISWGPILPISYPSLCALAREKERPQVRVPSQRVVRRGVRAAADSKAGAWGRRQCSAEANSSEVILYEYSDDGHTGNQAVSARKRDLCVRIRQTTDIMLNERTWHSLLLNSLQVYHFGYLSLCFLCFLFSPWEYVWRSRIKTEREDVKAATIDQGGWFGCKIIL